MHPSIHISIIDHSKCSKHIIHQLLHIKIHVVDPEFGVRFVYLFWHCHYLVVFLLVPLLLLHLPLRQALVALFAMLFGFNCDWLCGLFLGFVFLWLEGWLRAVGQEICVCRQNVFFLEHNVVGWVLFYLVSGQTSVCLNDVHSDQSIQHFLVLRGYFMKSHTFLNSLSQQLIISNLFN